MILVSNGPPLDAELREMLEARKQAKLPPLTKDAVRRKMLDIKQAKEYQYNPEEIQQMVSKKFEKGLKTGKIGGQNLSYLRISFQNDLNVAVHKLRETKDPKLQIELKAIIEDLEDKLSKL